ncbi:hypothetical protein FIBSPDRAFT_931469 [Athelia psychrophila]|uniref:Ricin B lectin domain-containing protein n=1 Tax=Athelia psychrophila TaxID=1759441 RepID=A0A166K955_9AGAM|nr:hypothetical protein FIBSPDRAFT_931469 [Fibularhizoctonia sp. CBS 109695]
MRLASTLMALAATSLLVGATPVDELAADSTACYTTHTGYFEGFEPFGLSADHHVVWPPGENGAQFKVHFQRCPKLTRYGEAQSFDYWGRLLASETSTVGANQCVTSTPSSTDGIIYLKLATCGSAYVPPASQSWEYVDGDFGKLMWFVGQCNGEQSGWLSDPNSTNGDPLTTKGTHIVKISCINTSGESSFTLSGLNP